MSDQFDQESASLPQRPELSDDLPPVQPPSAGFIVQLFVVPGLIVLAVVAVWALFGRIAAGEQDWRKLVQELQSPNTHIRNRAMYGLAQVLDQDRRQGEQGQHLSSNSEIAQGLSDQLAKELKSGSSSKDGVAIQQYLTRAMGLLDPPDDTRKEPNSTQNDKPQSSAAAAVATALKLALEPTRDIEIRKSAAASIAFIAGRALERGQPLEAPGLVQALIEVSTDQQTVMRQAAAFALGLFRSPEASQQLQVLLGNDDGMTRINAAIALSRSGSTDGLAVFKQALTAKAPDTPDGQSEHLLVLKNSLKAIADLGPKMEPGDKAEFRELTESLIRTHAESRIRIDAQNALSSLK
ncbi:MAG: HEAT repeat domain-containing protein [Planctomycetota bacterium]